MATLTAPEPTPTTIAPDEQPAPKPCAHWAHWNCDNLVNPDEQGHPCRAGLAYDECDGCCHLTAED